MVDKVYGMEPIVLRNSTERPYHCKARLGKSISKWSYNIHEIRPNLIKGKQVKVISRRLKWTLKKRLSTKIGWNVSLTQIVSLNSLLKDNYCHPYYYSFCFILLVAY